MGARRSTGTGSPRWFVFPTHTGKFQVMEMVLVNIYLFELSSRTDEISPLHFTLLILELALGC